MKQDEYGEFGPRPQFDDVSFLSNHFPLGQVHVVKDLGGTYNLNLLLSTERGNVVLRVYRSWVTSERLSHIQKVRRALSRAAFPVPLPLLTNTGETILFYNDHLMEIEPFITHDGIADTWEHNVNAFSLLGRLHSFFATELASIVLVNPVVSNYGTPETLLAWTQQAREEVVQASQNIQGVERQRALALYTEAIELLSFLQAWWKKAQAYLPRQLTHGDYGGGNMLFQDDRVIAVLDFDFLRVRERVYELAYTLYWWFWKQGHGQLASVRSWYRAKELLDAYNQAVQHPLSLEETRAIPLVMACVPLYWIAETHLLPDPMREVIRQVEKVTNARWIVEHCEQLMEAFT